MHSSWIFSINSYFTFLILLLLTVLLYFLTIKSKNNVPKCPETEWPIIGHFLSINYERFHHQLIDWGRKLEKNIFELNIFGEKTVIVNNGDALREFLISKSDDFAGRPKFVRGDLVSNGGKDIALADFNDDFLKRKKFFLKHIKSSSKGMLDVEGTTLDVLDDYSKRILMNNRVVELSKFTVEITFDVILAVVTGERIDTNDKNLIELRETFDSILTYASDRNLAIYDKLPWLLHFYQLKSYKRLKKCIEKRNTLLNNFLQRFKDSHNPLRPLGFYGLMMNDQDDKLSESEIFLICYETISAGFQTSSIIIHMIFALLIKYPNVKENIIKEIDDSIGFEKRPSSSDKIKMPYLSATILEVTRWICHVPFTVPHKAVKDTSLANYSIQKGTIVMGNFMAINKDSSIWGDPQNFRPERFLKQDGTLLLPDEENRKYFLPFGAGRRICPGKGFAQNRMFLIIVYLLQRFNFETVDHPENSKVTYKPEKWDFDLVLRPGKLHVKFSQR